MEQREFESHCYAVNSRTTRAVQVKRYLEFVDRFADDRAPFPCPSEQVALYATWLARDMTYRSVINYLSGLNNFLKQHGEGGIVYGDYLVAATIKGIRRDKGDAPRQAPPMLPAMLVRIFGELTGNRGHNSWRAAVLCSFRALLRKCQVTESESALVRRDFQIFSWGMIIRVRRSKTIQFRERVLEIPVARCFNKQLCAVYWTALHFSEVPASPDEISFRVPGGEGVSLPLTYKMYQEMLRIFSVRAGYGEMDITSHSLRRGGCTFLAMCGASIEEIKARGDWASETVYKYLKTPLQVRVLNDLRVAATLAATVLGDE